MFCLAVHRQVFGWWAGSMSSPAITWGTHYPNQNISWPVWVKVNPVLQYFNILELLSSFVVKGLQTVRRSTDRRDGGWWAGSQDLHVITRDNLSTPALNWPFSRSQHSQHSTSVPDRTGCAEPREPPLFILSQVLMTCMWIKGNSMHSTLASWGLLDQRYAWFLWSTDDRWMGDMLSYWKLGVLGSVSNSHCLDLWKWWWHMYVIGGLSESCNISLMVLGLPFQNLVLNKLNAVVIFVVGETSKECWHKWGGWKVISVLLAYVVMMGQRGLFIKRLSLVGWKTLKLLRLSSQGCLSRWGEIFKVVI